MVISNNIYIVFDAVIYLLEYKAFVTNEYWFEANEVSAFKNGYEIVKNLNIKFRKGERIIILGPNGAGKSSLVELINRNIYPVEKKNTILKIFNQKNINIWDVRSKISSVNNEIKSRFRSDLKVFDIIISGLYGKFCKIKNYKKEDEILAKNLISKMMLQNISEKRFNFLSDGEKQITLIARAIINKPEVLILDEPSMNLDLKSKFFLIDKIQKLSEIGINILCITHDIGMITKAYNRIIFIKNKEIIQDGEPIKIMTSENINKLFDINIKLIESKNSWEFIR